MIDKEKISAYISEAFSFERLAITGIFVLLGLTIVSLVVMAFFIKEPTQMANAVADKLREFIGILITIVATALQVTRNNKEKEIKQQDEVK